MLKKAWIGEGAIFVSCAVFACSSVLVKLISTVYGGIAISFFRFLIGAVLTVLMIALWEKGFKVYDKKAWILRGIFGSSAMAAGYWAIQLTSSGRAILLGNTYPMFVAVYGFLLFKEKITFSQVAALLVCFTGVLLVFYDHSHYSFFGNLVALSSGFLGGFAIHFMKKSRERNSPHSVYLSSCIFGLMLSGGALPGIRGDASGTVLLILLSIGLLAFVGQWLMTYGYKYVSATQGSVIGFSETLLTIALSFWVTGEEMKPKFWLGTGLIIFGLLINQNVIPLAGLKAMSGQTGRKK